MRKGYKKTIIFALFVAAVFMMQIFLYGCNKPEAVHPQPVVEEKNTNNQEQTADNNANQVSNEIKENSNAEKDEEKDEGILDKIKNSGRPDSYEMTPEDKALLDKKLTKGTKAIMTYLTSKDVMSPGDYFVFGLGVTNIGLKKQKYHVDVSFTKARDDFNNIIETDEETMKEWTKGNNLGDFELDSGEQKKMPIGIFVYDKIKPDKETAPGTYYFRATVSTYRNADYLDKYATFDFNVRVK